MWLQGLYIKNALDVVIGNALAPKGSAPLEYMKDPIRLTPLTEEEKVKKAREERQKAIDFLNNWAKQFSQSQENSGG